MLIKKSSIHYALAASVLAATAITSSAVSAVSPRHASTPALAAPGSVNAPPLAVALVVAGAAAYGWLAGKVYELGKVQGQLSVAQSAQARTTGDIANPTAVQIRTDMAFLLD